ncbi:MAG: hypothetical protein KDB23_20030 [Planctomycetales bacterium]|nr:hypothetical protein [Planctomycetales bacterium]
MDSGLPPAVPQLPSTPLLPPDAVPREGQGTAPITPTPATRPPATNTPVTPPITANPTAASPPIGGLAASLGIGAGAAGIPNMVGDYFGGGSSSVAVITRSIPVNITAQGFSVGNSGPSAVIAFETGTDSFPNDFFSVGAGTASTVGGPIDTFAISEPVPPSDAPVSPGPGATFQGGTAVHPTGNIIDGDTWAVSYSFGETYTVVLPSPGTGGVVVGRLKIAENASPLPRNRIFLNYSLFDNVPLTSGGVTVNRMTPGFETTMLDEMVSFELRAPMAVTLGNEIVVDSGSNLNSWEFGDLFLAIKALLYRSERTALSVGMSVALPTAQDIQVGLADGTRLVDVKNQSTHLMPFVGGLVNGRNGYFAQGFAQLDFDTNGNTVNVNRTGRALEYAGRVQDPSLLYLDVGVGRIIPVARQRLRSVAPMIELHYNRSLQDADAVVTNGFRVGDPKQDIQVLNGVAALSLGLRNNTNLTVGYATPIGNSGDQMFDGELRVLWNRFY